MGKGIGLPLRKLTEGTEQSLFPLEGCYKIKTDIIEHPIGSSL